MAVLIQRDSETSGVLRITLPLGVQLARGMRVIINQGQPLNAPYSICITSGCIADYVASDELIGKLRQGQDLIVQGVDSDGKILSLVLPLSDFGKAYDGPSSDLDSNAQR